MSNRFALAVAAAVVAIATAPVLVGVAQAQPAPATPNPSPAAPKPATVGEATFLAKCRYCHIEMGPGTLTLGKRLGEKNALLAGRSDLEADYVKAIVRGGLNTMPPINRVEVSDKELETIATWLATHNKRAKRK